jgi:SAM-dependent methyltransferase
MEIRKSFKNYKDWVSYIDSGHLIKMTEIDKIGEDILVSEAVEPLTNLRIMPKDLCKGQNGWREGLVCRGLNSRVRAVLLLIEEALNGNPNPRIYAAEAITPMAQLLGEKFPRFIGSEYTDNEDQRAEMWPIRFEDLTSLSFEDDLFDIVTTNEVLEHVPSVDQALSEIHRVLKPGGWHIGTHPFAFMSEDSIVKAGIVDGQVTHFMEPEYHGNPMSSEGSLVFEIPGWDIIERALNIGFSDAFMQYVVSKNSACLADHAGGIFVLCCQK